MTDEKRLLPPLTACELDELQNQIHPSVRMSGIPPSYGDMLIYQEWGKLEKAPRPAVLKFAERMEKKLQVHDHKGGWEQCNRSDLAKRVLEEVEEARKEARKRGEAWIEGKPIDEQSYEDEADEWADVANFAMMIADNLMRAKQRRGKNENISRKPI